MSGWWLAVFGQVGDGSDVRRGVAEIGALGDGGDRAAVAGPGRDGGELGGDLVLGQKFHGSGIPFPGDVIEADSAVRRCTRGSGRS